MLLTLLNIISNTTIRFLPLMASFFLIPYILGYVGKEVYGAWAILGAFVGMAPVFNLGFGFVLEKEVARHKMRNDPMAVTNFLCSTIPIQLLLACVVLGIFYLIIHGIIGVTKMTPLLKQNLYNLQFLLMLYLLFKYFANNFMSIIMGLERHYILLSINFIYMTVYVISIFMVLPDEPTLRGLVICNLMAMAAMFISLLIYIIRQLNFNFKTIRWQKLERSVFGYSANAFVLQLCALILFNVGKVILGAMVSVAEVSFYEIAYKIFDVIRFTFDSISRVFLPKASKLQESSRFDKLSYLVHRGTLHLMALWGAVAVPIYIFIKDFIALWIGEDFYKSLPILYVLLSASGFIVLSRISLNVFLGTGKLGRYVQIRVVSTIVYIVVAMLLTKAAGSIGLAVSLLIYSILSEVLILHYAFGTFQIDLKKFIFQDLLKAGALMCFSAIVTELIYRYLPLHYVSFAVTFMIYNIVYWVAYYFILVTKKEKQKIFELIRHSQLFNRFQAKS